MRRRDFLGRLAGAAAAGVASGGLHLWGAAEARARRGTPGDKRNRIGVTTWSLHQYFPATRPRNSTLTGSMLALLDFPEMIAEQYKLHHVEFVTNHLASTEPSYVRELRERLKKAHSTLVNMPVHARELATGGGLSDPDEQVRMSAVNAAKKWTDIGSELGTRAIRCDPGRMNPQNLAPTVESYKQLAAYGKSKGVRVLIENHGGVGSEHPEELVTLFKGVGSEFLGALPDFANFPDEPTREKGLELLFPHAQVACHAKGFEFDATGAETRFNFPKCVEIAKRVGFQGVYSIEFEGPGDPYLGVQRILDELLRYL